MLLGATKPPKKLTKNLTVGMVAMAATVGMVEAFDPNIYSVLAHVRPSAAPVVRYLLCLSTCAPGVGAHGGSRKEFLQVVPHGRLMPPHGLTLPATSTC